MSALSEDFRNAVKNASKMKCYRCHESLTPLADESTLSVNYRCRVCSNDQLTTSVMGSAEYQEMLRLANIR